MYKELAKAFKDISDLRGVKPNGDSLQIDGKSFNKLMIAFYFGKLLEDGDLELKFAPGKDAYIKKLLHKEK